MENGGSQGLKSVIVTGGNTGLGFECAKHIAAAGREWQVILACRNAQKAQAAVAQIIRETGNPEVRTLPLDLASLNAVREFVAAFRVGDFAPLHGIVCNAGMSRIDEPLRTQDGIEITFGINYLGHFLLVNSLLDQLQSPARIVVVSSELHRNDGKMKSFLPRYTSAQALAYPPAGEEQVPDIASRRYATSKLCLLLYAHALAERLQKTGRPHISVNAYNPGLMPDTGLGGLNQHALRRLFLKYLLPIFVRGAVDTPEHAGAILASLMTHGRYAGISGAYYDREHRIEPSAQSCDAKLQADLWQTSLRLAVLPPDFLG